MLGASKRTAMKNEVLYLLVIVTALWFDMVSNRSFIYLSCFKINSAAIFPDIKAGGTPGPGTVSWPVKYKFFTFGDCMLIL